MKVGIIGAGTMGSGIAQAFAQTEGYEVYLCDINEEFAANGKNKIAKGLQRLVTKGKKTQEDVDAILAKITTGVKDICTDCDLIVEAALEVMDVKKQTFKELQDIVKKKTAFLLRILLLCQLQKSVQVFLIRLSECTSSTRLLL